MKLRLMVNQGNLAREKLEKEVSRSRLEQARLNSMLVKAETSVENCRKHHSTSGVSLELEKTRAQLAFANGLISSYAGMNDQRILQQQQLQQQQHMWTTEKKMQNQEAVSILVNQSSSKSMIISPRIKTGVNNLAVLDADAVATAAKSDAKGNVDIASMVKPASAVVTDPVDAPLIFNTRNVKGEVKHTPISKKKKMMIKSGGEMSGSLNTFVFMCASIKREREEQGETWEVKYDEKNQIRTKAFTQKRIKTASIDGGGEIHKQFQQLRLDGTETQSSPPPVNQILVTPTIYVGSG